jgi:hypothetical protein
MAHSMFKKLAVANNIDFEILDKRIEFELDAHGHRIQYFNVASSYIDNFIARLGDHGRYFHTSFVNVETAVPPHTDIVDRVSVNFYIETGEYRTTFYQGTDTSTRLTYADHGDGHVYNADELEEIDSFVAVPGDVYVLNGKCIHAVNGNNHQSRKFIQVSSKDLEYDQVLDILNTAC